MCCCVGEDSEKDDGPPSLKPQRDEPSSPGNIPGQPPTRPKEGHDQNPNSTNEEEGWSRPPFPFTLPGSADESIGGRNRRIRRLYCDTGFDVAVFPNGKIAGTKSPRNKFGNLEFESAGFNGEIRIKGIATGFYITMTPKGRVVGQPLALNRGTIWVETKIGGRVSYAYMSLLSLDYAHRGYYLAIKKSGKPKAGHKTNHPYPQRAISFLPRFVDP